jgi:hypothetical protein
VSPLDADTVWCVTYGSNVDGARFGTYLAGGRPPGAAREYHGCGDRRPAAAVAAVTLPHRRYFALTSSVWGGGVAFVEAAATPGTVTRAVAYRITVGQLADVAAQENGGEAGDLALPERLPGPGEIEPIVGAARSYDTLLGLEPVDGRPAVTLTSATPLVPETEPAAAYVELIVSGLVDRHGITRAEALAELRVTPSP